MQTQTSQRSSLFLMELMIAILFFILASGICIRLFVKSHTLEQANRDLDASVHAAVSVAEIIRSQEDPILMLETVYPLGISDTPNFTIFYDKDWSVCTKTDGLYHLKLSTKTESPFLFSTIDVYKNDALLYTLSLEKYIPEEDGL